MIKNPLLEMKANELEKSEKIIRNTTKHSRILNEMICKIYIIQKF